MLSVLVIEDDKFYRAFLLRHFVRAGYHVEIAEGRGAAVRRIFSKQFDVVVLNIRSIDDVNELGIIPVIRHINPNIPIVAVTSDASIQIINAAKEKGVFYLFVKPFDVEDMVSAVGEAAKKGCSQNIHQRVHVAGGEEAS